MLRIVAQKYENRIQISHYSGPAFFLSSFKSLRVNTILCIFIFSLSACFLALNYVHHSCIYLEVALVWKRRMRSNFASDTSLKLILVLRSVDSLGFRRISSSCKLGVSRLSFSRCILCCAGWQSEHYDALSTPFMITQLLFIAWQLLTHIHKSSYTTSICFKAVFVFYNLKS
jgi:hypothetical protein